MKKLLSVFLVTAMLFALAIPFTSFAVIHPSDIAYAPAATEAPVLDGEADDIFLTAPEYVLGRIVKADTPDLELRDSSRVSFRVTYYEGTIYYFIDVYDDALISKQSDTHWKNDSIFLYFSEECNSTAYGSNLKSFQAYVLLADTAEPVKLPVRSGTLNTNSQYFCKITSEQDGSYHAAIEIALKPNHDVHEGVSNNPYVTNGNPVVTNGGAIAMDLQFNDQDTAPNNNNTRSAVWCWAVNSDQSPNNNDAGYVNRDKWGHVRFVDSTVNLFNAGTEWRFMTATQNPTAAPDGWKTSLTATQDWKVASAPFGCRAPGATKNWGTLQNPSDPNRNDPPQLDDGSCDNAYFWAVKELTLTADQITQLEGKALLSSMFYDQDLKLYVNGHLFFSGDQNSLYRNSKLAENATDILREGSNIIAVSLHQFGDGYEFDMNLYATSGSTDKFTAQTAIRDMEIPAEQNYAFYYQTKAGADNTTDFRILFTAKTEWLDSISTLEAVITFSNGTEEKVLTVSPDTVYKTVSAPETVYVAPEGTVVFGWIVTGMPESFATAETVVVTAELNFTE